ncbi:MAG TPA: hypothetical protein VKB80_31560 [Kofleriaceae bacterium]|nr:hypothetical protein [Kofleriaceae bacterium]
MRGAAARELSDAGAHAAAVLWSRVNVGDMLEGLMTPLALSFVRHYRDHVHGDCLAAVGMRDRGRPELYYRAFEGRVYANVSYFGFLFSQTPIGSDLRAFLRGFTDESVDLARYRSPYGRYGAGSVPIASWWYWVTTQARQARTPSRRVEQLAGRARLEGARFRSLVLSSLSVSELGVELERALAGFRSAYAGYMPFYFTAYLLQGASAELARRWLAPGDAEPFARAAAAAMSVGGERRRLLAGLARAARQAGVDRVIARTDPREIEAALSGDPAGRAFLRQVVDPFLREHGVRGRREMELMNPRWIDAPALLHEELQGCIQQGGDDRAGAEVSAAPIAPLAGLARHRRVALAALAAAARRWAGYRLAARPGVLAAIWFVRSLALELGRRLAQIGALRGADEVAFLELDEIRAFAADRPSGRPVTRTTLDARRRAHRAHPRDREPPAILSGSAPARFSRSDVVRS